MKKPAGATMFVLLVSTSPVSIADNDARQLVQLPDGQIYAGGHASGWYKHA